jgi:hypothetical protein
MMNVYMDDRPDAYKYIALSIGLESVLLITKFGCHFFKMKEITKAIMSITTRIAKGKTMPRVCPVQKSSGMEHEEKIISKLRF